ncbi:MAG: MBL fold metallo-hydrolase [Clostridium luticellarii]|jgi:glyoxylase-like metal-dependent hydrolase (beta-lactamase superfamily II)|uniref:Hydroxyacylglutathione hydrolase n=1 Tax=Clostridium luticellarii TaxID=1691940 RepID=A0A2T0BJB9_9CLOT|nr:MBL fold metallo-hydrolase [Clostridium luticellarii]MCI1995203.1 MBL fold metallo-hydrolase [Clostridium luticellarii]MCI2039301.1 MBL fold metallo-hydrolase [Clostridium luticellarii]PRR83995.1 hydroxyacylglutathione hydrolase [Clostridium luticellarii]
MNLNKIKGNTYYIDGPTNCGIFVFKNKNCLIVDTGINNSEAKKIDNLLTVKNLHPKFIINTHSHLDHCGGNLYFKKNYPGCLVYTSRKEKLFMENEELFSSMLSSSYPSRAFSRSNKPIDVDFILDYGVNKLNEEKFTIIALPGHSIEHIGIVTPEKVCFLGDSIFSSEILDKYSFPYLYNIEDSLSSLAKIKDIDADYFLIAHSKKLLDKKEISELADKNISNIHSYEDEILELLEQPLTREDILENITILNNLSLDFYEYHLNLSGVSAFISYLYNNKLINYSIEDGKLYYFRSK